MIVILYISFSYRYVEISRWPPLDTLSNDVYFLNIVRIIKTIVMRMLFALDNYIIYAIWYIYIVYICVIAFIRQAHARSYINVKIDKSLPIQSNLFIPFLSHIIHYVSHFLFFLSYLSLSFHPTHSRPSFSLK